MADWTGMTRSNYFAVKDRQEFEDWLTWLGLRLIVNDANPDLVGYVDNNGDGIPSGVYNNPEDMTDAQIQAWEEAGQPDYTEVDFLEELAKHVADGACAVVMEVGHEKARYMTGWAAAVTSTGIVSQVSISDIYINLKELLPGVNITPAEY